MFIVEKFKQYPLVLWALALYLCSLGFNFKMDIPLAILTVTTIYAFGNSNNTVSLKEIFLGHWHVIIFLVLTFVITLCSKDIKHSAQVQVQLLPALLMYTVITCFVKDEQCLHFVMVVIVFSALVTELTFLAQAVYLRDILDPLEKVHVIRSPLIVAPNDVLFFSVLTPIAAYLILKGKALIKIVGSLYLICTLVMTIYMQSRQATGVYLIGLCFMALLWRPIVGLAVAVIGVVAILLIDQFMGGVLMNKLVYLFPRRYVWAAAWQMFLDRLWVGQGPGMFKVFYMNFLEKAGYIFEQVEDRRPMNWAHSLYLEQLAERGVLGFLALVVLIGNPLILTASRISSLKLDEKALLSTLMAFLVAGIAETSLLRLWVVVLIFLLVALLTIKPLGQLRHPKLIDNVV